jgi:hypothetical protein
VGPEPVVPDYAGACLSNLVPALLDLLGDAVRTGRGRGDQVTVDPTSTRSAGRGSSPPSWLPEPLLEARQIVLLVLDGLGSEQLAARPGAAPTLASAVARTITSVVPSTTATALTSLVTSLAPAVHGVTGYRIGLGGSILNVLRWQLDGADARRQVPADVFQPFPAFAGVPDVPVVSRSDYAATGFTGAHLRNTRLRGWPVPSSIAVEVRELLRRGEPLVYAYYDGIDRVSHARGLGDHYDAELRAADRVVADVLEVLPPGAVLVVTADHGQVEVGPRVEVLGGDVMADVVLLSGEGRFRWLHVRPGATEDVAAAARSSFGGLAWVLTRQQVIEEGWMGGEPVPSVADRLGDVVLAPFEPTAFLDPADTGEQRLVGRHGSLTAAEMVVPLLSWPSPT